MKLTSSATASLLLIAAGLLLSALHPNSRRALGLMPRSMMYFSGSLLTRAKPKPRETMAKSGEHAGLPVSMVDRSVGQALGDYVTQTLGVAAAEVQKLYHDPLERLTRAVQPVLWLMLFGEVMARVRGVAPGNIPYLDFLAAGILAQSALFVAIFYGISAIWEHDLGVLQRYLVSPAPRSALVLGKALSAGVRALSQALILLRHKFLRGMFLCIGVAQHGHRDNLRAR